MLLIASGQFDGSLLSLFVFNLLFLNLLFVDLTIFVTTNLKNLPLTLRKVFQKKFRNPMNDCCYCVTFSNIYKVKVMCS